MSMDDFTRTGVESLTPEEHIRKADAAYAAAQEAHKTYSAKDRTDLDRTVKLADYLDLVNMVNLHANMATAKTLFLLSKRHVPVVFSIPPQDGETDGSDAEPQP